MIDAENEIRVGDEIRDERQTHHANNFVVCSIDKRKDGVEMYQCIDAKGFHHMRTSKNNIHKTGRHFTELDELYRKMNE